MRRNKFSKFLLRPTRLRLAVLLLLIAIGSGSRPVQAQPSPDFKPSQDRLIRACQMLYHPGAFISERPDFKDDERAEQRWWTRELHKVQNRANAVLNTFSRTALRQQLETRLKRLRPGGQQFTSVAYVLALRGVEVQKNARRVTLNWTQKTRETDQYEGGEGLGAALGVIYRRHPSDGLLDIILKLQGDAAGSMILGLTKQELLLLYPRSVLRVAAGRKRVLLELASELTYENGPTDPISKRIKATLQAMTRRGRPAEAQAARFLLRRLAREYAGDSKERLDNDGR